METVLPDIVNPSTQKIFNLESATNLIPLIYRLTEETNSAITQLSMQLDLILDKKSDLAVDLQKKIDDLVTKWHSKLERLGARPKGVWLADFDNGEGYFCWKFPEKKIMYFHGYQDGFTGRKKIPSACTHLEPI